MDKIEYSYSEVYKKTLEYFNGDDLATNVWISKYCMKELDNNETIHYYELTPDDMHHRLASEFYRAGIKYNNPLSEDEIYNLFKDFKYIIPQGRPMAGIGINDAVSISNCFVVGKPKQDSYGTIALIDQQIMQISKRGGGVGTDLSGYRANGSKVHNAAMTSSGPVDICANRFSNTIREVGQCIEENQKVITENGLTKIKDVKIGDKVWTKKGFIEVLKVLNNGEKELFKVKTTKGFEIITSKDHVYLAVVNGNYSEKKLSELNVGDNISLLTKPSEKKPILSEDQIISIEQVENGIAYDLSLAYENLFWCEGIYVHNCGRRGALMLSMSINHPDAESFMDSKMEDGKITGANISLKMYDKWLQQALNKETPDKEKMRLWKKIIHNAATKAEPGVLFWDTIIRESVADCYKDFGFETTCTNPCFPSSEYLLTENGYVKFGDLYKAQNKNNVITDNRVSYVEETQQERPSNWKIDNTKYGTTIREASEVFLTQKNAEVIKLNFKNGMELKCTPDHHIATLNRGMIEAKDLLSDDKILISTPTDNGTIVGKTPETEDEICAQLLGLLIGDGCVSKESKRSMFCFWGDDKERMKLYTCSLIDKLYNLYGDIKNNKNRKFSKYIISNYVERNEIVISSRWFTEYIRNRYSVNLEINKYIIPDFIINNSKTNIGKYFLSGLFYCDGSIQGMKSTGYTVRLSQSNESLLKIVQLIMHSNGITTSIKKRRNEMDRLMPDGKGGKKLYHTKANYEIITNNGCYKKFLEKIGFIGDNKKEHFVTEKILTYTPIEYTYMINREYNSTEDVYCIKEPITRSIIVNGCTTRRCGELPLCPLDSCRLMLLNLYSYVNKPFTNEASFNYALFADHSRKIMKLMDNMIDLEIEKIDKILSKIENDPEDKDTKAIEFDLWKNIKRMCLLGRRSGIGITAEGDMLAALGYKYGTKEATYFATEIQRLLTLNAYIESCDLVQIDGRKPFECFNYDLEKDNPFLNRLASNSEYYSQEFKSKWNKGRRNIALLTIAPAGSVSIETQTTSGIEPLFMVKYKRRRKLDIDSLIKPDFIDKNGDKFSEYNVVHNKFIKWYSVYENIDFNEARKILEKIGDEEFDNIFKKSPYFGATSNDCNWVEKVHMQGEIQKYIDHSISVTVNLPKGTTEDIVEQVYEEAWKSGCKGCTIYVDGSRDGVLIKDEKKDNDCHCKDFINAKVPPRPKTLPCKLIRFSNNKEKWIAAVGLYEEKPYEIFTGLLEKLNVSNNINDGFILKEKCDRTITDEEGNKKIIQTSCYYLQYKNDNNELITLETPLSETFNQDYWNYAKMVSGLLQGISLNYALKIIKSLKLGDDTINTWKNGVIRALKRFMKDEELDDVCPECGAKLWRISGCVQCPNCSYSKCN